MSKIKEDTRPLGKPYSWAKTHGEFLAGTAAMDGADHLAIQMEQKWGVGRLRLLVSTELREKFDRQAFKFNAAIWHGNLPTLQTESARMVKAWMALDASAEAMGASKLNPSVWECRLEDGTVAAIGRNPEDVHARLPQIQGRKVVYYTMDEIAVMLSHYREVTKAKEAIPGAEVTAVRRPSANPLDGIRDGASLEDTLNDDIPSWS